MDANSEYYPGGEVISQILQSYGLGDIIGPSRYRSTTVLDRNGYGRSYPRNRIVNNLNNAYYDSDPLAQEYLDRNYDYIDNTIRYSNIQLQLIYDTSCQLQHFYCHVPIIIIIFKFI
jgi:hypothetical protein